MATDLEELKRQGEAQLGRTLRVEWREMPPTILGAAWVDERGTPTIALAVRLRNDPAETLATFWHELAHHRAGDSPTPRPDPTNAELLARGLRPGYATDAKERFANNYAKLQLLDTEPAAPRATPAPAAKTALPKGETMTTSWLDLATTAAVELKGLTPKLRAKLDAMPRTDERERQRHAEIDGGAKLGRAAADYRTAGTFANPAQWQAKAERDAREGARITAAVCTYAGMPCPPTIKRLAAGEGESVKPAPAPAPRAAAQAKPKLTARRTPTAKPTPRADANGIEYASLRKTR